MRSQFTSGFQFSGLAEERRPRHTTVGKLLVHVVALADVAIGVASLQFDRLPTSVLAWLVLVIYHKVPPGRKDSW